MSNRALIRFIEQRERRQNRKLRESLDMEERDNLSAVLAEPEENFRELEFAGSGRG